MRSIRQKPNTYSSTADTSSTRRSRRACSAAGAGPDQRSTYLTGHFLAELGGMVLAIAILLATGLVVGWRVHSDALHATGAVALLVVFAAGAIWIGTWIGMLVRSAD